MAGAANFGKLRSNLNLERLRSMRQSAGRVQGGAQNAVSPSYSRPTDRFNDPYTANKMGLNVSRMRSLRNQQSPAKSSANILPGMRKQEASAGTTQLTKSLRKVVSSHSNYVFAILAGLALLSDFLDASIVLGDIFKTIIGLVLWIKRSDTNKPAGKIVALIIDCVPPICWLPITTMTVFYAWINSYLAANKAEKKLRQITTQSSKTIQIPAGEYI